MRSKLNLELLTDHSPHEFSEAYKGCYNSRGEYDSMQFVLRLRPDLHKKLEQFQNGVSIVKSSDIDYESFQAFSTYLHETVHWWQHIGSTSGLILGLSYPAQTHINGQHLKNYLKHTGLIKPIVRYNNLRATEVHPTDDEFKTINSILNNFHDVEFFKHLVIAPNSARNIADNPLFESVGHSYHIAYFAFVSMLSDTFDSEFQFLPKANMWRIEFDRLKHEKINGYYFGSPIGLPPVGLKDLYEGQARFTQIQYLHFGSGGALNWEHFEEIDMLSGVYYSAFATFLTLTNSKRPNSIDSPLVALFLLVLDLAINPTDGFPFEILHYESFIESVDSGMRFYLLCRKIATENQELKYAITAYTSSEYAMVVTQLSKSIACFSPLEAASKICEWAKNAQTIKNLMNEEKTFEFNPMNLPIRIMFSRFIRYQEDKLNNPAFFCWPGRYCAGNKCTEESSRLFLEHQSLFTDKEDGDIYPRKFPNKSEAAVQSTFDAFYGWVAMYDLSRQWVINDGEFNYDYFWLTSKYSMEELEQWARKYFVQMYGVDTKDFIILQSLLLET